MDENDEKSNSEKSNSRKSVDNVVSETAVIDGDDQEVGSPPEVGSATEIGSPPVVGSATEVGSPTEVGSATEVGSPPVVGSATEVGSPPVVGSATEIGSLPVAGSATEVGSAPVVGSATEVGSPPVVGSAAEVGSLPFGEYQAVGDGDQPVSIVEPATVDAPEELVIDFEKLQSKSRSDFGDCLYPVSVTDYSQISDETSRLLNRQHYDPYDEHEVGTSFIVV